MMGCDNDSSGPTDDDAGTLDDASIADVRWTRRCLAEPRWSLPEDVSVVDDGVADAEPADDMAVPLLSRAARRAVPGKPVRPR